MQVALDLSDSQVQDVLYLRQLFYGKRGQLARQRQALLEQFEKTRQAEDCVLDSVVEWTEIADRLCKNAKEEYRTTMQLAATLHIGVRICPPVVSGHSIERYQAGAYAQSTQR